MLVHLLGSSSRASGDDRCIGRGCRDDITAQSGQGSVSVVVEGLILLAALAGFPSPRLSISHLSVDSRLCMRRRTLITWTQDGEAGHTVFESPADVPLSRLKYLLEDSGEQLEEQVNPGDCWV